MKLGGVPAVSVLGAALLTLAIGVPAAVGRTGRTESARGAQAVTAADPASQSRGPLGWRPYRYGPFTDPAGTVCRFPLRGEIVRQDVWYRTSDSYPGGDPKDQLFIGPLYIRYINETNGKDLVANLSGSASIHYDRDGTQFWYAVGPFGLTFHPGNPYHRPGEYVIGGVTELEVHPGLVPQIRYHRGPIQSVCAALR
ncbi:MAG TPA: hypothetical protein VFU35_09760 [Jatrophihabitans sp.]|nr:hypothetical protein [Jatrophihabitans sp.]